MLCNMSDVYMLDRKRYGAGGYLYFYSFSVSIRRHLLRC